MIIRFKTIYFDVINFFMSFIMVVLQAILNLLGNQTDEYNILVKEKEYTLTI